MNFVFFLNGGVSLLVGCGLWLLWRYDKRQSYLKSLAVSMVANVLTSAGRVAMLRAEGDTSLIVILLFVVAVTLMAGFSVKALVQLSGLNPGPTARTQVIFSMMVAVVVFGLIEMRQLAAVGLVGAAIFTFTGAIFAMKRWHHGLAERVIAVSFILLGFNWLNVPLFGEAGYEYQAVFGSALRLVIGQAFAFTALSRIGAALTASRARYKELSEGSMEGIVVTDHSQLFYANPAALAMFGYPSLEQAQKAGPLSVVLPEHLQAWKGELHDVAGGRHKFQNAYRTVVRADGQPLHLRVSSWPTEWKDVPAAQIVLTNITAEHEQAQKVAELEKQAETLRIEFAEKAKHALLKANAELEERVRERTKALETANLAKSQFLANMSHEIRTPMNVIMGLLQLLRKTPLNEVQADFSEKAESASKTLLSLLSDILDFSKIEAGKMQLDPQPFEVERMMRDLSVMASANADGQAIEVIFDLDRKIPPVVIGDSMRLLQVLMNLTSNAIKFTPHGEVVIVSQVLARTDKSVTLRYAVRDTGIGIAADHLTHIFDVFSQAEASTTRRYGGSGLGLSICNRLLLLMGSELKVSSVPGRGSTFHFDLTLPLVVESAKGRETLADAEAQRGDGLSALVVDDNPVMLQVLRVMMVRQGWKVQVADSGELAIELVVQRQKSGRQPFDVICMDWAMNGLDGWETLARIDDLCPRGVRPVTVMVSAYGREKLNERTQQEQARLSAYLVKPVTSDMLAEVVAKASVGGSNLRSAVRPKESSATRLEGMRILIVEDHPLNQLVARQLLTGEGATVEVANNGREGVDAVAARPEAFDVVLMDMQMPVMDGCSATRFIREEMGMTDLPIIAMTANTMPSDRQACLDAGMNDHVGKPFDLGYLIGVLHRHASGKSAQPTIGLQPGVGSAPANDSPFDVEGAIESLGGDRGLYTVILRAYLDDLAQAPSQLDECLQANDDAGAARVLHTLKGTSATVGARQMAEQLRTMEIEYREAATHTGKFAVAGRLAHLVDASEAALVSIYSGFATKV